MFSGLECKAYYSKDIPFFEKNFENILSGQFHYWI
jgi:hypothetical protein